MSIGSISPTKKSILIPNRSPSGIGLRNRSMDNSNYSSSNGVDICNYDETIAKQRIHSLQTSPQNITNLNNQSNTVGLSNNLLSSSTTATTTTTTISSTSSNMLFTPPRGKLPTSTMMNNFSPNYNYNNNTPNSGIRYQLSPLETTNKKYQNNLLYSSPTYSSPTSSMSWKRNESNIHTGRTNRILRDAMEVLGVREDDRLITDKGIDNLRKILGRYLQDSIRRLIYYFY